MAGSQDYGIKISQPGFDVNTCKDYELIFSSSWPTLAIAFDKTMTLTTDGSGNATIPHNLNFYPLAMGWKFTDSTFTTSTGRFFVSVDKTNIYIDQQSSLSLANTTYYVNVKCYNLDITIPQNYLYLQSPAVNFPYDNTYGIKIAKQNENINSSDMRNFILNSRAASPQVLAVVTEKTNYNSGSGIGNNSGTLTYTNPQNYTPWAFGYVEFVSGGVTKYIWAPPFAQAYPLIKFNNNVTTLQLINTPSNPAVGSLIILRDPLFVSNSVQATY